MKNRTFAWILLAVMLFGQPTAFAAETVSGETGEAAEASLDTQNVTMNFDSVPLKDVLKIFSKQSGFSFAASEELQAKKMSVYFENIPLREALDSLTAANNMRYEQKRGSKVIVFYPPAPPADPLLGAATSTRVFRLKFMRLSSSPMDIGGRTALQDLTKSSQLGQASSAGSAGASEESAFADTQADKGVDKMVLKMLSRNGSLTSDLSSNTLIVTDTPAKLDEIAAVLEKLDVAPDQVLLEVHLVEVKEIRQRRTGMSWGGSDGQLASFTGGSRTTGFPFTERIFNVNQGVKADTSDPSELRLGTLSATSFTATLRLILNDTHTKILARPRVLTMNNEAANIRLVTNTAISNTTTISSADGLATSTNTAERSETGIILKMTPQINDDDTVGLYVEPSITTVAASVFFPAEFLDPTTRSVKTLARVKNHETLVIGGLIDKNKESTVRKVPFLGDLPLVGNAFKNTNGDETERELIVFITPHIYRGNEMFDDKNTYERDAAVKRMLDVFAEDQYDREMDSVQESEEMKKPLYLQDKKLIAASAKRAKMPEVDRQMSLALDSFSSEGRGAGGKTAVK
jgi:type IV pilus assembly protein PilQ